MADSRMIKSKFKNVKTGGYDSRKEAKRGAQLELLQRAGKITNLTKQVKFELIPSQWMFDKSGKKKCIERAVIYKADFQYIENGQLIVEDVKGLKLPEYIIKRKLMLYTHGIKIKET